MLKITPSTKTFLKDGRWIEHTRAVVLVCACGNKYIKTRIHQHACIRCISRQK